MQFYFLLLFLIFLLFAWFAWKWVIIPILDGELEIFPKSIEEQKKRLQKKIDELNTHIKHVELIKNELDVTKSLKKERATLVKLEERLRKLENKGESK